MHATGSNPTNQLLTRLIREHGPLALLLSFAVWHNSTDAEQQQHQIPTETCIMLWMQCQQAVFSAAIVDERR
jgi:hypothetical protein